MLYLRGEGDSLPSMQHFGRDALRQSMYRSVFGVDDGSSALSRENPFHYIDVAGQRITRKALHDEVTRFLEEQVNSMTATPDLSGQNQAPPSTQPFEDRNSANRNLDYGENEGGEQFERNDVGPVASWGAQQHSGMMPGVSLHATPLYGQPATNFQQQHYLSMLQQQQAAHQPGQFISQQFLPPHGMMLAPSYLAPQTQPLTFYPGRQTVPQVGQFNPYAPQFLPAHGMGMHQLGGPMMQPQLVPNYQPAMSGMMPPHVAPFAPGAMRPMQQYGPQWPQMPARVYAPSSRTSSPMPRAQSRGGRNVVSDVRVLPYRPGSDDMYPRQTVEGSSVRLQELQREGPSYNFATHPENLPFIETARHSRPAEWGVLKIGNVSKRHGVKTRLPFL